MSLVRLRDKASGAFTRITMSVMIFFFYQIFTAGVIDFLHIPVDIISLGIINLISAAALLVYIIRGKKIQKLSLRAADIIFLFLLILAAAVFARVHYSGFIPNYAVADPAAHMSGAKDVMRGRHVYGMYYSALLNALLFETALPFTGYLNLVKVFVFSDLVHLFMSGAVFYAVTADLPKKTSHRVIQIIISLLYLASYPLNNTLYGFIYLGMGVTVCLVIYKLTEMLISREIDFYINIALIGLANFAIFESYQLFMPVIFLSEGIVILAFYIREKMVISKRSLISAAIMYIIPILMGLYYAFFGMFSRGGAGSETVSNAAYAISKEGGIYRELLANFLMLSIFVIYGLIISFKEKKAAADFTAVLIICSLIFMTGLFIMGIRGYVSSYYFYKMYFLIWAPMSVMSVRAAEDLWDRLRPLILSWGIIWCIILGIGTFGLEQRLMETNENFVTDNAAEMLSDIYASNYKLTMAGPQLDHFLDSYEKAAEIAGGGKSITIISRHEDAYWFKAVTDIDPQIDLVKSFLYKDYGFMLDQIEEKGIDYILIEYDEGSPFYADNKELVDSLDKIYEDEHACIVKADSRTMSSLRGFRKTE